MIELRENRAQLGLFDDGLFSHIEDRGLVEKFKTFHLENPSVYGELKGLALEMLGTGRNRYGIAGLFEVLRWNRSLKTSGDDFKLNNSYRAFYARLMMSSEPRLSGFFRTRQSVADKGPGVERD